MPQRLKGQVFLAASVLTVALKIWLDGCLYTQPVDLRFSLSATRHFLVVSNEPVISTCRKFNSKDPRQLKKLRRISKTDALSPFSHPFGPPWLKPSLCHNSIGSISRTQQHLLLNTVQTCHQKTNILGTGKK